MNSEEDRFISLQEASKLCDYSPEYLRLLARQEKIFSKRIGRNWYTTEEAIKDYVEKQSPTITVSKDFLTSFSEDKKRVADKIDELKESISQLSNIKPLPSSEIIPSP